MPPSTFSGGQRAGRPRLSHRTPDTIWDEGESAVGLGVYEALKGTGGSWQMVSGTRLVARSVARVPASQGAWTLLPAARTVPRRAAATRHRFTAIAGRLHGWSGSANPCT